MPHKWFRLDWSSQQHNRTNPKARPLSLSPPDLADLIEAVARGERLAFRQLYDAAAPKLFGIILRMSRSRAAAEEVLQDVFLKVWNNAGQYSKGSGSAMGWLTSVARNRAIDVLRQKTEQTMPQGDDGEDWFAHLAEDRDREGEMLDRNALAHCLGQIEAEKRSCILLAYYEGFSREELADKFGQPVNTIKTWLHRGLATLKTCLETR